MKIINGIGMRRKIFSLFVIFMFVFEIFAFAYALDSEYSDPYADTTAEDTIDYSSYDSGDVCDEYSYAYDWCKCNYPDDYGCCSIGWTTPECGYDSGTTTDTSSPDYVCTIDADYSEYGVCEGENIRGGTNAYECVDDGTGNGKWSDYLCNDYGECNIGEPWGLCGDFVSPAYTCENDGTGNGKWSDYLCQDCPPLPSGEVLGDGLTSTDGCYSCANGNLVDTNAEGCDYSGTGETCTNEGNSWINDNEECVKCLDGEVMSADSSDCENGGLNQDCDIDGKCNDGLECNSENKCVSNAVNEGCYYDGKQYDLDEDWYGPKCLDGKTNHTWTCNGNDLWIDNDECSELPNIGETCTNEGNSWINDNEECVKCLDGEVMSADSSDCEEGCKDGATTRKAGDNWIRTTDNQCMECLNGKVEEVERTRCIKSCENDAGCTEPGQICDNNHCLPGCRAPDNTPYSEEEKLPEANGVCKQCVNGKIKTISCGTGANVGTCTDDRGCTELGQICKNKECIIGCRGTDKIARSVGDIWEENKGCVQCNDGKPMPVNDYSCLGYGGLHKSCGPNSWCSAGLKCNDAFICVSGNEEDCVKNGCSNELKCNGKTGKCEESCTEGEINPFAGQCPADASANSAIGVVPIKGYSAKCINGMWVEDRSFCTCGKKGEMDTTTCSYCDGKIWHDECGFVNGIYLPYCNGQGVCTEDNPLVQKAEKNREKIVLKEVTQIVSKPVGGKILTGDQQKQQIAALVDSGKLTVAEGKEAQAFIDIREKLKKQY